MVSAKASYSQSCDAFAFQSQDKKEMHSDSAVERTHLLDQICQLNNRIKVLGKKSWRGTECFL